MQMECKTDIIKKADALIMRSSAYKKYMAANSGRYVFPTRDQAALSLAHFAYWVREFPDLLKKLRARVSDDFIARNLEDIIESEEGRDDGGKPHHLLLIDTLASLGLCRDDVMRSVENTYADKFVCDLERGFVKRPVPFSIGVQYALEKLADPMLKTLRASLEQFAPRKEYNSKYFDIHIIAEEQHGDIMEQCLFKVGKSIVDLDFALQGMEYYTQIFDNYWGRLYGNAEFTESVT